MKRCPGCGQAKPLTDFYSSKTSKSGVRDRCKDCEKVRRAKDADKQAEYNHRYYQQKKGSLAARSAAYYVDHKDELAAYNKMYRQERRQNEPEKVILGRTQSRAKRKGIPFNLQLEDIHVPDLCPVLGIPILLGPVGKKGGAPNSPSIDRINPDAGYVKGNVRIISNRANTLKNDASVEELEMVLRDLANIKGCD